VLDNASSTEATVATWCNDVSSAHSKCLHLFHFKLYFICNPNAVMWPWRQL